MHRTIPEPCVPIEPEVRRAWIRLELAKHGYNLASLGQRRPGIHLMLRKALSAGHSEGERRIAKALGISPKKIWPERYDRRGRRIRKKPGPKPLAQHAERAQ